uniref:Aldehyde dehydrogenase domain-containing protein n=1 Tax=Parascaris equorum TaxID=6256 RepID=A0A914RSY4_PAREQ
MYLNDKSTGSVVGQQPFGGARMSGNQGTHFALSETCGVLEPAGVISVLLDGFFAPFLSHIVGVV